MIKIDKKIIRNLIFVTSLAFVVYGASRGEADTVLHKAAKLCLECIGIG